MDLESDTKASIRNSIKSEFKQQRVKQATYKLFSQRKTFDLSESLSSEDQDLTLHGNSESVDTETLDLAQQTQGEEEDDDEVFELKCNSQHHYESHNDDVIPFDECEYEKIVLTSTNSVSNFHSNTCPSSSLAFNSYVSYSLLAKYRTNKSKSLSCLHDRSLNDCSRTAIHRYMTRTMSNVNLKAELGENQHHQHSHESQFATKPIVFSMKVSKTESEIFGLSTNLSEMVSSSEANQECDAEYEAKQSNHQTKHHRKHHRTRYNYSRIGKNDELFP